MTFKRAKSAALIFIAAYFTVGIGAHLTAKSTEDLYPFFSWFLFSRVPPRIQSEFEIRILEINDKNINPPVRLREDSEVFKSGGTSEKELHDISERLGRAALSKNEEDIALARRELESKLVKSISYEVSHIDFDILDRWQNGKVISERSLARFSNATPQYKK